MSRSLRGEKGAGLDILMVANTLPPKDLSGAGEQIVQLRAGLEQLGHRVRLLGRGPGGAPGPKVLFPLTVLLPLVRSLRREPPDVVQLHESDGGLAALAIRLFARRPRPTMVALQQVSYLEERRAVRPLVDHSADDRVLARPTAEEITFRRFRTPFQILLGRLTSRLADRVLVPSRQTGRELERDYGCHDWHVLPNVTGESSVVSSTPPVVRQDGSYLLFVGRLRIRKGVEVLLESLSRSPGVRLLIAGEGERRSSLERRIEALGLSERVELLGRQSRENLRQVLAGATALVVPSTYEGMPLVILEAMECGVPVVASAVSGIPEVVVEGETGWLVPAEHVSALSEVLLAIINDPDEARRRGEAGRQRLEQLYRPANAAAIWLEAVVDG